jgi:hypothetical protein
MCQFQIANLGALIAISMSMFSYQKLSSCLKKNNNILMGDLKQNGTKPLCPQSIHHSARLSGQSSELGPPLPHPQVSVVPPVGPRWKHTRLRWRWWEDPIQTTGQKAWHSAYSVDRHSGTIYTTIPLRLCLSTQREPQRSI